MPAKNGRWKPCGVCTKPFWCTKSVDTGGKFRERKYCGRPCYISTIRFTPEQVAESFWAKVNKTETCWLWTAATENPGYGHYRIDNKDHRAHRFAYELVKGPIPAGMQVLHSCDVMLCVNPAHLRIGTMQENMAEMKAKGRHKSGSATLTPDQVREIRKEYKRHGAHNQTNCRALSQKYGVSMAVIWRAARAENVWRSVK